MFIAGIQAVEFDQEGSRILDAIEQAQELKPTSVGPSGRQYMLRSFTSHEEAIAALEAEAVNIQPDALEHVRFGVPGKNA